MALRKKSQKGERSIKIYEVRHSKISFCLVSIETKLLEKLLQSERIGVETISSQVPKVLIQ